MNNFNEKNILDSFISVPPTKKYLYETHCHCSVTSKCSLLSPADLINLYVKNGYSGVIVTDHFLNGNCITEIRSEPDYKKQIEMFCEGYKQVKVAAEGKLDVFFGLEASYKGTDVLVYGWNENDLKSIPEIMNMSMKDFILFANENGALTIQAHPFREASYIDHIRLFPNTQGVEIYNAARNDLSNALAYEYYRLYDNAYGKIRTAGSDAHALDHKYLSGMAFDSKISSISDFIERVKKKDGEIFRIENALLKQ